MNKNTTIKSETIKLKGDTILEEFKNYIKENKSPSDIIGFLSLKNAWFLSNTQKFQNGIPKDIKNQIIEFYLYFMNHHKQETYELITKKCIKEPLILRVGNSLLYEKHQEERKKYLMELPNDVKKETESLRNKIMAIRKQKCLSFCLGVNSLVNLVIPKIIPRNELDDTIEELTFVCAKMLMQHGSLVVRVSKGNHLFDIFGIKTNNKREWIPISSDDMVKYHTDFGRLKPEEGVTYIEISKEDNLEEKVNKTLLN